MIFPPWLSADRGEWLTEVTDWVGEVISSLRLGSLIDITSARERPWGAVFRVKTSDRMVYFKAEGFGGHHEVPVLAELAKASPELGPAVLAADSARSWLLMADHGRPIWDVLDTAGQVAALEQVLPLYAELQRSSARLVEVWLEAGAPDRRVAALPERLRSLLADEMPGGPLPILIEHRRAIDVAVSHFAEVCEELGDAPYADALDHGDLHGGNVLVDGGDHRLVDWGDSCVTHPFSSLFVTFQLAVTRFCPADRAAAALRLRDAYLEAWTADACTSTLRKTFTRAVWVGYVTRALNFAHMVQGADTEMITKWQADIVLLLRQWADAHALLDQGEVFLLTIEP